MCNCKKFNVPGVEFSRLDSGLEIISVTNKFASAKLTTNGAHIFEFAPAGEKNLLWVSKKAYMEPGNPFAAAFPSAGPGSDPAPKKAGRATDLSAKRLGRLPISLFCLQGPQESSSNLILT